ncbi:VWA domain-containing protein [Nocardia puris]|uniref:Stress response protein SCP2 n=1 Tax=Nocardia puris TaxID=208602 RepID=A0A366DFK1_9NOCA|nr:VWA domain-containing protein [Nocardia puris]MBF6215022.1 VWA domain-containing protein [Nocardia puris]MBF6367211.1 VWA domain-containing protein [Nocardia puris]MBF6461812.1 VWA domain-containing protein [Nocardia puris]RBO88269.1 stress response protein SCP2 [Nocardia puris]
MVVALVKGQNGPIAADGVVVSVRADTEVDVSALLVTESGKVRSDADFVFYNQPEAPGVELRPGTPAAIAISFGQLPADIAQVRAVLTLDGDGDTFGRYGAPVVTLAEATGNPLYEYVIGGLDSESVVIALEVYRRGTQWKVRAVGQGYAGGFAALVTDHGVVVDDESAAEPQVRSADTASPASPSSQAWPAGHADSATPAAQVGPTTSTGPSRPLPEVRTVPGETELSFEKRAVLDLRKREVAKVLIDGDALGVRARVVLVIDKTGSMAKQYRKGVVHRVVERMVPVATQLDDDGTLEAYLYARRFAKLPDIDVAGAEQWARTYLHLNGVHGGIDYAPLGGRNDELPIIRTLLESLRPGGAPTLVLFFTDGGFAQRREISALLRDASRLPAFWQFVGLGAANYGLLRELDDLDGRVVDNAGFFALDDIDVVDDAQLYTRLLGEFPQWLRAAAAAGVTGVSR